jgi:cell division protein FtsW (lipid II flippase)
MVFTSALLLLEPDFGAFAVIVMIAFGILYLGGLDWRLFSACCCCCRSGFRRFSSPHRIGCSGSSHSSTPGPIRSARVISSRIR